MTTDDAEMKIAQLPPTSPEPLPRVDAYRDWQRREGVRVIEDYAFSDLTEVELSAWERKGGSGAIINVPSNTLYNDAHLVEIAPEASSQPERHLYEEQVYVLSGGGSTVVWQEGGSKSSFEWSEGSLFSIPLNAWYQHFNTSGRDPARYVAVTNAPPMMRLFSDDRFIFDCPYNFSSRFNGQNSYFSADGKLYQGRIWRTNFVPDARNVPLYGWKDRGAGGANLMLEMADGNTKSHISEFPVGTYKKGHRHGPGAHLIILNGTGFSLLWNKADQSDMERKDWTKNGMVIVPRDGCFHQHFNSGTVRSRYLALKPGTMGLEVPGTRVSKGYVSIKDGGSQIEYQDEAPQVHEIFEAELARHGATCRMKGLIPYCTGEVGPTDERHA